MKKTALALAVVTAIAASYRLGRHYPPPQTRSKPGRRMLYYVDPMHPAYKSGKPGTAPDCGMALEPVYAEDSSNGPPSSNVGVALGGG
jgi:membrane fusion protein, copper/silver efflux system